MNDWLKLSIFCIVVYILCNFNFAVFISKIIKKDDIRNRGSKNPGTTNMFRVFGAKIGIITYILDMSKGVVSTLVAILLFSDSISQVNSIAVYCAGVAAGLGHVFPVFYNFRGGKGFATGVGVFMVISPIFTLIALVIGVGILLLTDRMSIFALCFFTAELVYHLVVLLPDNYIASILVFVYWAVVIYAHRSNIRRLIEGKENKMGLIKKNKNKM